MHPNILNKNQTQLLPLIEKFSNQFYLVGGTAIALHLGHRRSIDFDLFSYTNFDNQKILKITKQFWPIQDLFLDSQDELTIIINKVKITWYNYPYKINCSSNLQNVIKLPNLVTLAAMKAYALGRRAKWKDYVDLYFIFQKHSLEEVVKTTQKIFKNEFNQKLFREQLAYHQDIDYSEPIEYFAKTHPSNQVIKRKLTDISLS
ncbi:nucleotidyl transferase AbiEii/AbiGii toxin family protein [Patescibacteria group bacterium]|nr:nucleotidyl transferase AbiEii/AbiGii toxin family protein [Patescibacteria group bacterium]